MNFIISGLIIFVILLSQGIAYSENLSLEQLVSKIQKSYEAVNDLTATFEQETVIQDFKTSIKSQGNFLLKKKDKMRLSYLKPKKEEILINGTTMITYLPDEHQAIQGLFSKTQESKLPLRLLSGEAILKNEFDIRLDSDQSPNLYRLLLKPFQIDPNLEKILIEIDPVTFLIKNLWIYQSNDNYSSFRFSHVQINTGIKETLFQFTPPEGTDVIKPFGSAK